VFSASMDKPKTQGKTSLQRINDIEGTVLI
jgi:hypothetical protein